MEQDALAAEAEKNTVAFPSVERAVRALAAMRNYFVIRTREIAEKEPPAPAREPIKALASALQAKQKMILNEEALEVMGSCAIPFATYQVVYNRNQAITAGRRIGYPVAMKTLSPEFVHKTEAGGVRLDLRDDAEVAIAFDHLSRKGCKPGSTLPVLVQEMVKGGKEVILGMKRDVQFGPVVMFGMGGIYAEIFKDVSFRIAPLTTEDAFTMIAEVKGYSLLKGARGEAPSDIGAIADALRELSQLALDFPEVEEIDLNPFIVFETGKGGRGVDARMSLRT
jgi:acyl-CoA synthetase (NDP forming)